MCSVNCSLKKPYVLFWVQLVTFFVFLVSSNLLEFRVSSIALITISVSSAMSIAMDKTLMAMSLEEEDVPFDLPDLPEFSSIERNYLSLIGRILNPDCQPMPILIVEMPRKWQKVGKCRGVALSKEKFQFIFDNEFDLLDVLDKEVHTFNEWTLVIERWVENPPKDYLQYIPLWV